jgi:hypothetical protein
VERRMAISALLAVAVWRSMTGWPCRDDLVPGLQLGGWGDVHMVDPGKNRADLDHVALGTGGLLVGSAFMLLGSSTGRMHGRWAWPRAWWLGSRSCCSASRLVVTFLLNRWALAGSRSCWVRSRPR